MAESSNDMIRTMFSVLPKVSVQSVRNVWFLDVACSDAFGVAPSDAGALISRDFTGKDDPYPLVNVYIAMERSTMFNGKIHYFFGHFQLLFVSSPEGKWMDHPPKKSEKNLKKTHPPPAGVDCGRSCTGSICTWERAVTWASTQRLG